MIRKQHLHATPVTFDFRDSVMLRSLARSCKLEPEFTGPYVITAKLHGPKFKVLDSSTTTSQVVHADRLKKVRNALSPLAEPFTPLSSESSTSSASHPVSDPPLVTSVSSSDSYRQKLRSAYQL